MSVERLVAADMDNGFTYIGVESISGSSNEIAVLKNYVVVETSRLVGSNTYRAYANTAYSACQKSTTSVRLNNLRAKYFIDEDKKD